MDLNLHDDFPIEKWDTQKKSKEEIEKKKVNYFAFFFIRLPNNELHFDVMASIIQHTVAAHFQCKPIFRFQHLMNVAKEKLQLNGKLRIKIDK